MSDDVQVTKVKRELSPRDNLKSALSLAYASLAPVEKIEQDIEHTQQTVYEHVLQKEKLRAFLIGLAAVAVIVYIFFSNFFAAIIFGVIGGAIGVKIADSRFDVHKTLPRYQNNDAAVKQDLERIQTLQQKHDGLIANTGYQRAVDFVPTKYRHSADVNWLFTYLDDGRADTLKEAINIYEQELHNWRMEQMQQQIIDTTQQAALDAEAARIAAQNAEVNSAVAMYNSFWR